MSNWHQPPLERKMKQAFGTETVFNCTTQGMTDIRKERKGSVSKREREEREIKRKGNLYMWFKRCLLPCFLSTVKDVGKSWMLHNNKGQ